MPKNHISMQDYILYNQHSLKPIDTLKIMFQVVNSLKHLHSVGYVHNDIKPGNIMMSKDYDTTLIDFGFAKKYVDSNNKHLKQTPVDNFQGNILFASPDQQMFKSTSRRDDLISACYLLFTLLNQSHFPLCTIDQNFDEMPPT